MKRPKINLSTEGNTLYVSLSLSLLYSLSAFLKCWLMIGPVSGRCFLLLGDKEHGDDAQAASLSSGLLVSNIESNSVVDNNHKHEDLRSCRCWWRGRGEVDGDVKTMIIKYGMLEKTIMKKVKIMMEMKKMKMITRIIKTMYTERKTMDRRTWRMKMWGKR